jgi:hypothetical protein
MDKVRKPSNSVCYTPSSEPYRIYFTFCLGCRILPDEIECIWMLKLPVDAGSLIFGPTLQAVSRSIEVFLRYVYWVAHFLGIVMTLSEGKMYAEQLYLQRDRCWPLQNNIHMYCRNPPSLLSIEVHSAFTFSTLIVTDIRHAHSKILK